MIPTKNATATDPGQSNSQQPIASDGLELNYLCTPQLDPLFRRPPRVGILSAWYGHVPFAYWIVRALRPRVFVELGTHSGVSYSTFCDAIMQEQLDARCYAVDTWKGDEHSGFYGEEVYQDFRRFHDYHYSTFSDLLRCTFDDALPGLSEASVDLLHIDGWHSYEAVRHDFESWSSKLSDRSVVLFHDTNVRERGFGVWKYWEEIRSKHLSFEFFHDHGLGVLAVGREIAPDVRALCELKDARNVSALRQRFALLGERWMTVVEVDDARRASAEAVAEIDRLRAELEVLRQREEGAAECFRQESVLRLAAEEESKARSSQIESLTKLVSDQGQQIAALNQKISHNEERILGLNGTIATLNSSLEGTRETIAVYANTTKALTKSIDERDRQAAALVESAARQDARATSLEHELQDRQHQVSDLEHVVVELNNERDKLHADISTFNHDAEHLRRSLTESQQQLTSIRASSSWQAIQTVTSALAPFPRLNGLASRLLRGVWWTISLQLPERLRTRKRLLRLRDVINNSPLFDAKWYLSEYPDVAASGVDPALHYIQFGASEQRNPSPHFDSAWYLKQYDDVAAAGVNPLMHFIRFGKAEGRTIRHVLESDTELSAPAQNLDKQYEKWIQHYDTLTPKDISYIHDHLSHLLRTPLISVLMPVHNPPPEFLRKAIESVFAQLYTNWELCIADDASSNNEITDILAEYAHRDPRVKVLFRPFRGHISAASNSALTLVTGDYVALMDHDDELAPHALYMVAWELNLCPAADIIYSDEDILNPDGHRDKPYFKPDWNPELFYSQNFINHLGIYRTSLVRQVGGFRQGFEGSQDYDLALRVLDHTTPTTIRHIPHILYHWRVGSGLQTYSSTHLSSAVDSSHRALAEYFASRAEDVRVVASTIPYWNRVVRKSPMPLPLVSLLVPTRNKLSLLRNCLDGLLNRTNYEPLEVIIIDNESDDRATLTFLESLGSDDRVRVLRVDGPFNFAALNNKAVAVARGEIIGFINNDIAVIDSGWLDEMVSQVSHGNVAAVGAKLSYPDDTVQHGGVVLGMYGVAGHAYRGAGPSEDGYFGQLQLVRNVSCVTAACMLVRKTVFMDVGGFDEVNLPVSYNDVDLCLRIRDAGYDIVWTPYARFYHFESASRGSDADAENVPRAIKEYQYMKARWGVHLNCDPFYNPNLSLEDGNCRIAFPPRVSMPWRRLDDIERDLNQAPSIEIAQRKWDDFGRGRLSQLLFSRRRIAFELPQHPLVSIVIVLRNKAHLSLLAIESIYWHHDVPCEVVIVDNGSTDETADLLDRVDGAVIVRNADNIGFGPACVKGAASARGNYLCFFNNDALLQPEALSKAIENFRYSDVGAVGGKILLANGSLQEAGSIIWRDGTTLGYGRNEDSTAPQFNFRRTVDYCSAAFLFTPRALFVELGGFDSKYSPAYYEDADYCMRVWNRGLRVLYEPEAVIRHYESASSGSNKLAQALMLAKQGIFVDSWSDALQTHLSPSSGSGILRAGVSVHDSRQHLLYIDDSVPHRNLGAGFPRGNAVLRELVDRGYRVTCATTLYHLGQNEYRDISRDIELLDVVSSREQLLGEYLDTCDLIWVSRPNNLEELIKELLRRGSSKEIPIIYDAEAIFAERDCLKAAITGRHIPVGARLAWIDREIALAKAADSVVCVSSLDARRMTMAGVANVVVARHCVESNPTPAAFQQRNNFLFIGRMHGPDCPNTDSMRFFCENVWPGLRNITGAELLIAGRGTEMFSIGANYPKVQVLGALDDLTDLYNSARVFVAPTRYAAGIPLKVYEAASHGVPAVVSTLVGQQIGWSHGVECLVADNARQFVDQCAALYRREKLWNEVRERSIARVADQLSPREFSSAIGMALGATSCAHPRAAD